MIDTKEFYDFLLCNDIGFFTGVPDSLLKELCACITSNSNKVKNIIAANEGNAVGLAAGYHLATGKIPCVYMQNSGEGNAVNPLLSLVDKKVYSIPMLIIIGWRGEPGIKDEPQHIKQGEITLNLLETMNIPYKILSENYKIDLKYLLEIAIKEKRSVALVVRKDSFSKFKFKNTNNFSNLELSREQALEEIINVTGKDPLICTTGKLSREVFEIRKRNKQKHCYDFLTVGSMGHASSIALGVSLNTKKNVWCLDGDGAFIMHMGGLAICASYSNRNFKYVLNNNQCHESVGGQPTISGNIDIKNTLLSFGFKNVYVANTKKELIKALKDMKKEYKCALIVNTRPGSRSDLGRPTITPIDNKIDFMKFLKGKK